MLYDLGEPSVLQAYFMMVEDHPYDYRDFEGVIPAGSYGGGTVIVWDEGTYEPLEDAHLSRKEQEKLLLKQLYSGNLKFILNGKKIRGEFALFQMKSKGDRSWILMKKKDEFATNKDILKNDKSVKSGKTLVQIATENGTTVNHPEEGRKTVPRQKPIQLLPQEPKASKSRSEKIKKSAVKSTLKKTATARVKKKSFR